MTFEIAFVLLLLAAAVVLFATEKLPVDLVALMLMSALMLTGIITASEGLAGFSNTATVTVGVMFVLSAGLFKTGAANNLGGILARLGRRSFWLMLATLMIAVGVVSAFINNTAAVAILLPIMVGVGRELKLSVSKLLMPLSFASMFGGVCTLMGTSTNILVSSIAERRGQPPFEMFEFAPLGLLMLAAGTIYMMTVGVRLIPDRLAGGDLAQEFRMDDYLTDIVLLPEAKSTGKTLAASPLVSELEVAVLDVFRDGTRLPVPSPDMVLEAGSASASDDEATVGQPFIPRSLTCSASSTRLEKFFLARMCRT